MMKIYNYNRFDRKKTFLYCILLGVPAAIGLGFVYWLFVVLLGIQFPLLYTFAGYLLGRLVLNVGHGVHTRFSVLAAVLAAITFIFGDVLTFNGGWMLLMPTAWPAGILFVLRYWFRVQTFMNPSTALGLIFRLAGIYEAYINARIGF